MDDATYQHQATSGTTPQTTLEIIRGAIDTALVIPDSAWLVAGPYNVIYMSEARWLVTDVERQAAEIQRMAAVAVAARRVVGLSSGDIQWVAAMERLGREVARLDADAPAASTERVFCSHAGHAEGECGPMCECKASTDEAKA